MEFSISPRTADYIGWGPELCARAIAPIHMSTARDPILKREYDAPVQVGVIPGRNDVA